MYEDPKTCLRNIIDDVSGMKLIAVRHQIATLGKGRLAYAAGERQVILVGAPHVTLEVIAGNEALRQGSGSNTDSHSFSYWMRIRILNRDTD